ncbi:MAG: hypothetical protein J6A48_03785, partial [Clostridia bacterium]|nr:hypothetical protein [Clostridia bacterium]
IHQEYPTTSYDDMSFSMPMDDEPMQSDFGSYLGTSSIPTPAAMPSMMQQQGMPMFQQPGYQQGYQPQQPYQDYGMQQPQQGMQYGAMQPPVQQPMQSMDYGQQYQPATPQQQEPQLQQQPAAAPAAPANSVPAQPMEQPAAPVQSAAIEKDELGVPAFLRRPTRK